MNKSTIIAECTLRNNVDDNTVYQGWQRTNVIFAGREADNSKLY